MVYDYLLFAHNIRILDTRILLITACVANIHLHSMLVKDIRKWAGSAARQMKLGHRIMCKSPANEASYEWRYVAIVVRVTETLENEDTPDSLQVRSGFPRTTTQLENVTGTSCSHNDRATLLATGEVGGGPVSAMEGQSQESVDASHGVLDVFKTMVQLKKNSDTCAIAATFAEITAASGSNLTSKRAGNMIIDQPKSISLRDLKSTHNNK
ncbi:hypothetical protein Tco_0769066 [Tanacetum coccineum]|uniref:Uncharacterized protein n=1 Tax=Tanacetum coccineum TaxID=301880 RepID=A0ABQ4Z8J3_9ASTR